MLRIIWRFRVKQSRLEDFRRIYGRKGEWAEMFVRSPEYQGTILLQDVNDPLVFVTIDHWVANDSLERFKQEFGPEYGHLDRQCETLTDEETAIGAFSDEPN